MKKDIKDYQNVHLIGIGGASMYSIAAMLKYDGKTVTGSDMQESENTEYLKSIGIKDILATDEKMNALQQAINNFKLLVLFEITKLGIK